MLVEEDRSREQVKEALRKSVRAQLDKENIGPESMRTAMVGGLVDATLKGITPESVRKGKEANQAKIAADRAKGDEEAKTQREKDVADLNKGLGSQFIAEAEARRLAIETTPNLTKNERVRARKNFFVGLQRESGLRLERQGVEPGRAEQLQSMMPGLINNDIGNQIASMRAQGFRQKNMLDNGNGPGLLNILQQRLMQNAAAGAAATPIPPLVQPRHIGDSFRSVAPTAQPPPVTAAMGQVQAQLVDNQNAMTAEQMRLVQWVQALYRESKSTRRRIDVVGETALRIGSPGG
jgi:hypothetical protein